MEICSFRVEHSMPWQTSAEGFIVGVMMVFSVMGQEDTEMQRKCSETG